MAKGNGLLVTLWVSNEFSDHPRAIERIRVKKKKIKNLFSSRLLTAPLSRVPRGYVNEHVPSAGRRRRADEGIVRADDERRPGVHGHRIGPVAAGYPVRRLQPPDRRAGRGVRVGRDTLARRRRHRRSHRR